MAALQESSTQQPTENQFERQPVASRRGAATIGFLFLLATVSYLTANQCMRPIGGLLTSAFDSTWTLVNSTLLRTGVTLELISSAAIVGIVVLMFPVLRRASQWIASAFAILRVAGSLLLLVAAACTVAFSRVDTSSAPVVAEVAWNLRGALLTIAMIGLGAAGTLMCWVLYKEQLVPRALSALGLVGYPIMLVAHWADLFNDGSDPSEALTLVMYGPRAVFELALGVWLLVKGFSNRKP